MKKFIFLIFFSMLLASCGGGGGGGGGGAASNNIRQFSSSAPVVNIGESEILSATGTIDRFFVENEQTGGGNIVDQIGTIFGNGFGIFSRRIRGNLNDGTLTTFNPPRDVRTVWREGWTGKGVNILIADNIDYNIGQLNNDAYHGYIVAMSANETAPRATYYGLELALGNPDRTQYLNGGLRDQSGNINLSVNTKIDVVNMSFGSETPVSNPSQHKSTYLNDEEYNDILQGGFLTNTGDAVLTKAAGNAAVDADKSAENLFLATDETTKARILIIGALDKYAQEGGANIASYSNRAGNNEAVQRRFLVEHGGSPFTGNVFLCSDASTNPADCGFTSFSSYSSQGTSFSAPRVAGLAALVRGKFPNLSGAQTAKILLDTATMQGLSCHPNCDSAIYGQGRVDIANALSPIGKLK
ncbi:hypothetical protein SPONN_944 [uncultured Candidatus Thioglobus sp.]|nr:hypothetical protein SPONN_944 [uncultured Candidatus Thioglobus sp.]